jgi:hypothetical protein
VEALRGRRGGGRGARQAEREFDARRPQALLPLLGKAHSALRKLPSDPLLERKRQDLEAVMASCAGLWLEAVASRASVCAGEPFAVATSVLVRTPATVTLESVAVGEVERAVTRALKPNQSAADTLAMQLPEATAVTQPYWLRLPSSRGLARVADRADLGAPENRPALTARFRIDMAGERVTFELPVAYRWVDPVQGERWRQLEVGPPATLAFRAALPAVRRRYAARGARLGARAEEQALRHAPARAACRLERQAGDDPGGARAGGRRAGGGVHGHARARGGHGARGDRRRRPRVVDG